MTRLPLSPAGKKGPTDGVNVSRPASHSKEGAAWQNLAQLEPIVPVHLHLVSGGGLITGARVLPIATSPSKSKRPIEISWKRVICAVSCQRKNTFSQISPAMQWRGRACGRRYLRVSNNAVMVAGVPMEVSAPFSRPRDETRRHHGGGHEVQVACRMVLDGSMGGIIGLSVTP